ncbi:NAD(P)/FAD-dependent oxidoreductase [Mycoplasmopsis felis]|nr:NAD(P)/FAD-dependent oxidoreductase [Mycoplasmopsis felis]MCU9940099.1 NAD(P)/FAD-dependent oxidoreductase [Mycoplasmopsis felis]
MILGGGNSAVEEGTYLTNIASHVYIVIKDAEFNAEKRLVQELLQKPNVTVFRESQIKEINGSDYLESAIIIDKNNQEQEIKIGSFFPYIGMEPTTTFIKNLDILDEKGFILTDEFMQTKVKGIFAAGDIRKKKSDKLLQSFFWWCNCCKENFWFIEFWTIKILLNLKDFYFYFSENLVYANEKKKIVYNYIVKFSLSPRGWCE